jgi:hypothetical protein
MRVIGEPNHVRNWYKPRKYDLEERIEKRITFKKLLHDFLSLLCHPWL